MRRDFKVSSLLNANMILFINISEKLSEKNIYIMAFSVAHWVTRDDSFAL